MTNLNDTAEKEYLGENELIELYQDGQISLADMQLKLSPEREQEYRDFCKARGLQINEESAMAFSIQVASEEEAGLSADWDHIH